ncbi:hypothetical protein ACOSQ2_007225 [Xanthoceras sorbifolium]
MAGSKSLHKLSNLADRISARRGQPRQVDENLEHWPHCKGGAHFGQSPRPAYELAFDWENERSTIFGQRIPETPMAQREKLSEDFYYRVLPTEMQDAKIFCEPRDIFYLDAPSASVCLLSQIERLAVGTISYQKWTLISAGFCPFLSDYWLFLMFSLSISLHHFLSIPPLQFSASDLFWSASSLSSKLLLLLLLVAAFSSFLAVTSAPLFLFPQLLLVLEFFLLLILAIAAASFLLYAAAHASQQPRPSLSQKLPSSTFKRCRPKLHGRNLRAGHAQVAGLLLPRLNGAKRTI